MSAVTASSGTDTGILLDAGTNEVEILVFQVAEADYGVNVAKVREVTPIGRVTRIYDTHESIDGVVGIRDNVVPLVNLESYLDRQPSDPKAWDDADNLLLLEFNDQLIAFRVQTVKRIFRISWSDTCPVPAMGNLGVPIVSIASIEEQLVPLLDFELIAATVGHIADASEPVESADASPIGTETPTRHHDRLIVVADDSRTIGNMICDSLSDAGYTNVQWFTDGELAWQFLNETSANVRDGKLAQAVAAVVSDIEMPRMDGFHLTKRIRQSSTLGQIPVVLFSSIVSTDNEKKGRQAGATAQLPKSRLSQLPSLLSEILEDADSHCD